MRTLLLLIIAVECNCTPAAAQVTVDLHALDALPAANPAPHKPAPRPAPRPKVTLPPNAAATPAPAPAAAPVTEAPAAVLPAGPPPVAAAPVVPASPVAPPPAPAVASVRLPFATDQTDLGPDGAAAIKGLIDAAAANGSTTYTVVAYAAGTPDDPSNARRLSLARALAARSALIGSGVPSSRITVRALGSQAGGGPPDRVDISTGASNTP
jgi:outer membrane protein OmpA-like peptidoglycan-associated protein